VAEQRKLPDLQARLDYAAAHGIHYLVEAGDVPGPAAYRNSGFTVFAVNPGR
jgi:hypothetical protein